jgi:alkyl hydroperoxide reductase subunit AhpC
LDLTKKVKLMLTYPMTTGRNFDNRPSAGSLQLTARENVATPVNWKPGRMSSSPFGTDDAAKQKYPQVSRPTSRTSGPSGLQN